MSDKKTYSYTIHDRDDRMELMFDVEVEQEEEVDTVSEQICKDLNVTIDQIDWRDEQECWVWAAQ